MSSPEIPPDSNPPADSARHELSSVPAQSVDGVDRPHGAVTVMHPVGITPYAAEGLTLGQPLFARVTYRPQ